MRAVVFYHDRGLVLEEAPRPVPGAGEVLVRVVDAGFCGSDHSVIEHRLAPDGYILGHEVSGVVAETGPGVSDVPVGLRVMIRPTFCGACPDCRTGKPHLCEVFRRTIGIGDLPGAFAEFFTVPAAMLIPVPDGVDAESAALAETFASALHGLRCAGTDKGSLLVIGGGPIGLSVVRLAKILGFGPIVLSEPVAEKRAIGLAYGADVALDPLQEDLAERSREKTDGRGYDTVLECSGIPANVGQSIERVAKRGVVCIISVLFVPLSLPPGVLLNLKECRLTAAISNTHEENRECLAWMAQKALDARLLVTDRVPLEDLPRVYRERIHPGKAIKVLVKIGEGF